MTGAEIAAFEKAQAERLFTIARTMTALGLEGEDPADPRVARLMDEAAAATDSVDEMVAWIRLNRSRRW